MKMMSPLLEGEVFYSWRGSWMDAANLLQVSYVNVLDYSSFTIGQIVEKLILLTRYSKFGSFP